MTASMHGFWPHVWVQTNFPTFDGVNVDLQATMLLRPRCSSSTCLLDCNTQIRPHNSTYQWPALDQMERTQFWLCVKLLTFGSWHGSCISSWLNPCIWCPKWKVSGLLMLRHSSFHQHNRSTLCVPWPCISGRGWSSLEYLSVCTPQ